MLLLPSPMWQTAQGNSPELCRRSMPVQQIMIFVFPAFTLSSFSSSQEPPDIFLKLFSMITRSSARSQSGTHLTSLQTQRWRAAGWVPSLDEHNNLKLFTVPLTNIDMVLHIGIHPLPGPVAQSTSPHQVFSAPTRWPSKALNQMPSPFLWESCSLLLAARYFSCSCLFASFVPLLWTNPNWESGTDTNCLMRPSTILSRTFMTCSVSLRPGYCPCPEHPSYPCRGRQWNSAPSWRVPCHRKWLQLQMHGSWRHPCHQLLLSSPPLCLMGQVLCQSSTER